MADSAPRRLYIDWARAVAVLLMIEAHTVDAWTRAPSRATAAFRDATILGGFAAPLFMWLAGVALVLAASANLERHGDRGAAVDTICRRGLEIFALAFLFRLQAFVLTPGGHPVTLFRVDILNVMGPAIAAAGIVWGMTTRTGALVAAYAGIAAAIAMLTPILRATPAIDVLPIWVQWYIRPAGDNTTFTSFPWAGFVFAGAACGVLIAAARTQRAERRLQIWLAGTGAALIAAGLYAASRPSIYRQSSFWTTSPTWFAIRVGVLMLALAAIYALSRRAAGREADLRPLARLGRSSLFVYWIHVELVYGYATWPIHSRLPLWGALVMWAVFSAAMYGAVVLRDALLLRLKAGLPVHDHLYRDSVGAG